MAGVAGEQQRGRGPGEELAPQGRDRRGQAAWLLGLVVASRLVFRVAIRKVTVQGG